MKIKLLILLMLLPAIAYGQFSTPASGGGTSDSMGVDTNGDGTIDNYLYSTTAGAFHLKKGSNATLTVTGDTVTIAGAAGSGTADSMQVDTSGSGDYAKIYSTSGYAFTFREGTNIDLTADNDTVYIAGPAASGTADSMGVDTDGDGTVDNYLYSTVDGAFHLKEKTGMTLVVLGDTVELSTTLGTSISTGEILDQTIIKDDIDSTASNFVFDAAYEGTSAEADSQYSTHNWVQVEIEDSLNEVWTDLALFDTNYTQVTIATQLINDVDSICSVVQTNALIEDSLNEYALLVDPSFTGTLTADSAQFDGNVDIDSMDVNGVADFGGTVTITGTTDIQSTTFTADSGQFDGNVDIDSLDVNGVADFGGDVGIVGLLTGDSAQFDGNVDIDSMDVNGVSDFTGAATFAGAVNLQSAANPTVTTEGGIAWESDDENLRVYDGSANRAINTVKYFSTTIFQPDSVNAHSGDIPILSVEGWAPFGIKLLAIGFKTSANVTDNYAMEEWTDPSEATGTETVIDTVALSTNDEADSTNLSDSDIANGSIIMLDIDSSVDDIDWLQAWGTFYIKTGD